MQEYDPHLANRTLGPEANQDDEAARQMMRELGLDDGELEPSNGCGTAAGGASSTWVAGILKKGLPTQQSGGIAAYFPAASDDGAGKGPDKMVEQLRVRLEASLAKLHNGQVTGTGTEEVEELLHDQQHQIELLVKGNFSLRGSMNGLRRNSKEIESRTRHLQEELEQQHQAALRQMETKLELAIQQVQLLQQGNRERQQQQEANAQLALSAATWEVQSLKTRLDDLQQMEETKVSSQEQASVSSARAAAELQRMQEQCSNLSKQLEQAHAQGKDMQNRYDGLCKQLEHTKHSTQQEAALSSARAASTLQQVEDRCSKLCRDLEQAQAEKQERQTVVLEMTARIEKLEASKSKLQQQLNEALTAQRAAAEQVQQLQQDISNALQQLADAEAATEQRIAIVQAAAAQDIGVQRQKWREEFLKRRKLHNLVVELKGNIRVLARIRPHNDTEKARAGADIVESAVRTVNEETILLAGAVTKEFEFDRVFGPSDGQQQVYEEVSSLVTSIMDGFNVCIMAYGQTGSGKTYTIEGPPDNPGVNSRALAEVFAVAEERSNDISYSFSASVLEIYNEQIFDLLAGSRDTGDKFDVKEGSSGLFIPGLRVEPVHNLDDVAAVLQKGKQNRSTFATNMNEHSSRSHLVLSLYVKAEDLIKGTSWSSKLHLIDLAGSERVSRSGAEGERLKEAAAINKSLSALGDVLAALQQRNSHIPYRNSKLTRLLEDSLGGNSKMLMVVNCSPAVENVPETKCSLEFAARARKVELGAASRNAESPTVGSPAGSPLRASIPSLTVGSLGSGANSASSSPRSTISRPQSADVFNTSRLAASRRATGLQQ
eukprot:gene2428-2732_t